MNIEQLVKDFKTFDELKAFTESQFKQILILSKKIKDLEEKNKELSRSSKEINNLSLVPVNSETAVSPRINLSIEDNDAKIIAQVQLSMLKKEAFDRELTLEEVKKLDIFNKVLNVKEDKDKPIDVTAKTLSDDELLSKVNNGK